MYEYFDAGYQDNENILIERHKEERMTHIQRETLQMLASFLTPFKEASLQLEADTYATLPLILPIRFNLPHYMNRIALFLWPNFRQLRMLSTQEQEETMRNVQDLIDEFKRDEQLGPIVAATPENLCEGSVSDSDQHSRMELKITDFSEFEDAVKVSKNQNNEIEKYMHINMGRVDLNDLLNWWKNYEDEFSCLSRVARNVLGVPATSASSERNFSVAGLAIQKRRTSLSSESVDSIVSAQQHAVNSAERFSLEVHSIW
jgi:hypothetical protein